MTPPVVTPRVVTALFDPSLRALTQPHWLSEHWEVLVVRPARLLLILAIAFVVRALLNRMIARLAASTATGSTPSMLRPLRDRVLPGGLLEGTPLQAERRQQRAETIGSILRSIVSFAVFSIAVVLVLGELGINLAPIVASAGVVGVAVGFGAQNLVRDFLSGMAMLLEDQYGVGDVIDVGEATGTVEAVGLRTTRLRDVHGTVWYVRNGEIVRVGNKSQGFAQVVLDIPLAHGVDLVRAGTVVQAAADGLRHDDEWSSVILDDPTYLGVEEITTESVIVRVTVKTRPGQQWRVGRELRQRLIAQLEAADVATATRQWPSLRTD
ncbi:MAG: mechanosensitive ion channel [Actinobacteria bacterium]|nr:mechanosensitive ion channel [Actinomycetota bacterium]MBI3688068.1 mechanosensitive ion channel [Actinomycetota bacterium]